MQPGVYADPHTPRARGWRPRARGRRSGMPAAWLGTRARGQRPPGARRMDTTFPALLPPPRWRSPLHGRAWYGPARAGARRRRSVLGGDGRSDGHGSATRLRGETRVRHARCLQDPRHRVGFVARLDRLASPGRRDGRRGRSELQMAEDRADHLARRDDGDAPQHARLTPGAAGHLQGKDPLEQPRPTPARRRGARLRFVEALLAWRREECPRWTCGRGTSAASFARSSSGVRRMPVVPSDHGGVKGYTRSLLVSSWRRASDTAPRAVSRRSCAN
jgi:hypothetical protein